MSETTPPVNPPAAAEPQIPAEASAQKKQTVRISLPPKPAGGPSIRVPSAAAAPAGGGQQKISKLERSVMLAWLAKAENRNIIAGAVLLLLLLRCLTRPDRECWQCQAGGGHGIGQVGYHQGTGVQDDGRFCQQGGRIHLDHSAV